MQAKTLTRTLADRLAERGTVALHYWPRATGPDSILSGDRAACGFVARHGRQPLDAGSPCPACVHIVTSKDDR